MPLRFWAAQTTAAALELHHVGTVGLGSTAYIPPHTAATTIQLAYQFYDHRIKRRVLPDIAMDEALSEFTRMRRVILFDKPFYPFDDAIKFVYTLYVDNRHWMQWKEEMATLTAKLAGIGTPWMLLDNG
jgi:hypothetical protein